MRTTRRPCQSPSTVVKQESEGTDENYQSSYAIHCAALELLKKDGFQFRYTFEDKDDYNSYMERYTTAYTEKSDLIRAGGFKIYTSLDSSLQDMLQADIDQGLSSYTELQDNGKYALQGAGVIVDNRSNYVVAIVGGRGSGDQFNRDYLSARQPGSTIKPSLTTVLPLTPESIRPRAWWTTTNGRTGLPIAAAITTAA